ncbi:MAG: M16 family metallopeptidase, partial [Bacteroidota bacterium]
MKKSDKSRAKLLRQFEQKQEVEYNKTVLDNGLRVISEKVPGVESFALGVCANFGSRDEPDSMPGIAHFLEHACFRRTKNRTAREIASQLESVGAYSNAFTTKELTCFYVRSLTKHFRKTLNILADISLNPVFQELDIKRERSVILEEIKSYEDDPEEYIFDLGDLYLFGENSFGNPILGTRDSIKKINAEVLEKYHSDRYSAANMVISAAGNIDHDRMVDNIHRHFGSLGRGKLHLREV